MKDLFALHVGPRTIIALYELQTGERIAEEHSRIGSPVLRHGTWKKANTRQYAVTFGRDEQLIEANTITGIVMSTVNGVDSEAWAERFRRAVIGQ